MSLWPVSDDWWIAAITGAPHMDALFCVIFLSFGGAYDLWSRRKLHPATIWGRISMIIVEQVRIPIGMTGAWHHFAAWAQHLA
jgi:hypothetical protein